MSITLEPAGNPRLDEAQSRAERVNPAKTFTGLLACLEDGALAVELTRRYEQAITALSNHVLEHGGEPKAKLTLTLSFCARKGQVEIDAAVTDSTPKPPRLSTTLYAAPDGGLTPFNPRQMHLFRDVNSR